MEKDSDSTATSLDENTDNFCDNPTRDTLAEGLISLFKPTVDRLDERVQLTRNAQFELLQHLNKLLGVLKEIAKVQALTPSLSDKVNKLINIKQRVLIITNILHNCHDRLAQLHRLVDKEQNKIQNLVESRQ